MKKNNEKMSNRKKFAKAIACGNSATVKFLLDSGVVGVNDRLPRHANPPALVFAARHLRRVSNRALDVFQILLNRPGADFDASDSEGTNCSHLIVSNGNSIALRLLIDAGVDIDKYNLLHMSYEYDCTVLLLAAGADVSKRAEGSYTPLHLLIRLWSATCVVHALIAGGADLDAVDCLGMTPHELLGYFKVEIDSDLVEKARCDIAKTRLDFVRRRALQVCIGLQSFGIPALLLCEIMLFSCGPVAPLISFHQWWNFATTVKHFQE
jgi:ankyrin repeat protein